VELRSFKLRVADAHVRIVPATDDAGCPFAGAGVDLRGSEAEEAFRVAAPLLAALAEFEPGVVVRAVAVDVAARRVLATFEAIGRPRVVRLDTGPALERAWRDLPPILAHLTAASRAALARRAAVFGDGKRA
jgi:hypothetical protein